MALKIEIPKELSHLKLDDRGYPIPFFVSIINGKPEFRFMDHNRVKMIIENKLCHICGNKLYKDYHYFISGPLGLQNRISSDAAMHRVCAEFSLMACPHLYLQKAERRDNDELGKLVGSQPSPVVKEKPSVLFLVKSSKFKTIEHQGQTYIKYNPVSSELYTYVYGKLQKQITKITDTNE